MNLFKRLNKIGIVILGFYYTISAVKDLIIKFNKVALTGTYRGTIEIDDNITNLEVVSALIHEAIEIMCVKNQIDLDHNVISKLEVMFMNLIISNPELFKLALGVIVEEEKKKKSRKNRSKKKIKK